MEMKSTPWAHQLEDWIATRDLPEAFIPWEPRCGKTKLSIDTAAWLAEKGEIDAAVVVTRNGVHLNWTREELPKHWPLGKVLELEWITAKADTVAFKKRCQEALGHPGFVWFTANIESVALPKLNKYLHDFAKARRAMLILDEAHNVKDVSASRTKALMKLVWPELANKKKAATIKLEDAVPAFPYRRALTGTPTDGNPCNLWSQYYILHPKILGRSYVGYKNRVSVVAKNRQIKCKKCGVVDKYSEKWEGKHNRFTVCAATNPAGEICGHKQPVHGKLFEKTESYQNLDKLNDRIAPWTFPRKKADCPELNLPGRFFSKHYFIMSPEHRRVYDEMRDNLLAQLTETTEISSVNQLSNLMRLQQISRGFVRLPDKSVHELGGPYPAAEETLKLIQAHDGKAIIWCRFVPDVILLQKLFTEAGIGVIRCDGSVPPDDRPGLRVQFREDPAAIVWLGTASTGGEGVDLGSASLMINYSHSYSLIQREQSLERNFGSTQMADRIDVIDMVAADSVDIKALAALARKENIAKQLTPSKMKELLQ